MSLTYFFANRLRIDCFKLFLARKSTAVRPTIEKKKSENDDDEKSEKSSNSYLLPERLTIRGETYETDGRTNLTPRLLDLTERGGLHRIGQQNPISFIKLRIRDYFYTNYRKRSGTPLFSLYEDFSPVVTIRQNFDSLLVPSTHVSRSPSDTYYVNSDRLLRSHTSAHQHDLFKSGLDHFLVVGDVYRRDVINRSHYPCFHQMEGASIYDETDLRKQNGLDFDEQFVAFETNGRRTEEKQADHTLLATKTVEKHLKTCLEGLVRHLFGSDVKCRWTETYFPFTHPSWELEVWYGDEWLECLGCGIIEQELLKSAGVDRKLGWAFGLGLERLAMRLYDIPDIRLFWSKDTGFLHQFRTNDYNQNITFKPFSKCPQCTNDLSFWLPTDRAYNPNDFYDLVRTVGGDLVEQVFVFDEFTHPKTKRQSHAYRIVYRHNERPLTQNEVNDVHAEIERRVGTDLGGAVR